MAVGERMLVRAMADAKHNGIYVVTNAGGVGVRPVITRATDYDNHAAEQVDIGDYVLVSQGTNFAGKTYMMNATGTGTNGSIKIGTNNITWVEVNGAGPQGATGPQGAQGAASSVTGPQGPQGKGYILTTGTWSPSSTEWSIGSRTIPTSVAPNTTAFVVNNRVRVARNSTNYIEGEITALDNSGESFSITVSVDTVVGSRSSANHTIAITGELGSQGAQGSQGSQGPTGPQGSNGSGVTWVTAPTNYNSAGTVGQFAYNTSGTTDYLYACVTSGASGTARWIRIASTNISTNFTRVAD
jgi:hypothetical protein